MIHSHPRLKVSAAHVAPVFLDTDRTIDKACSLIAEAARAGAGLVAFPETFIPAFPIWTAIAAPILTHELFKALAASAIDVDGPQMMRVSVLTRSPLAHYSPKLRGAGDTASKPFAVITIIVQLAKNVRRLISSQPLGTPARANPLR